MGTFFKVDRAVFETQIWKDPEPYDMRSAWIYLIGMANFKESKKIFRGQVQVTKRGQLQTSLKRLAEDWHWSINKVRRYLGMLEALEMVHAHGTARGTTITIENYAKYQDRRQTNGTPNEYAGEYAGEYTDEQHNKKDKEGIKKGEEYARTRATPNSPPGEPYAEDSMTDEEAEAMIAQWDREIAERRARGERLVNDDDEQTDSGEDGR